MKYRILARFIRACLLFGVLVLSISILLNVYGEIFNAKKYLRVGNATFGETTPGFTMRMGLQISIPDTIITFKNGKWGGHNIGIGIMVIILAKVIKDAVEIKQENDLTIKLAF